MSACRLIDALNVTEKTKLLMVAETEYKNTEYNKKTSSFYLTYLTFHTNIYTVAVLS